MNAVSLLRVELVRKKSNIIVGLFLDAVGYEFGGFMLLHVHGVKNSYCPAI